MLRVLVCLVLIASPALAQGPPAHLAQGQLDWLVHEGAWEAELQITPRGEGVLTNGLVSRTFALEPYGATVGLKNLATGAQLLRAVKPEVELVIDGETIRVGGLAGQVDHAFLSPDWRDELSADPHALHLTSYAVGEIQAPFGWNRARPSEGRSWPPRGKRLTLQFDTQAGPGPGGLTVTVHHELYDGLPVLGKYFEIQNGSDHPITLDRFVCERLALVEAESRVDSVNDYRLPDVQALTDMSFGGMSLAGAGKAVQWVADPEYATQVNYAREAPLMLETRPPIGPGVTLAPGEIFRSFRSYLVIHDNSNRERQGLALRRFFRVLSPWCTENPILMHVRSAQPEAVRLAIDQCAEVGFEMVILTFGSGFNMENEDPAYLSELRGLAEYAHERGVELGGYSLLSSRRIGPETDVIDRATGEPGGARFGSAPCLGSEWGIEYFAKLRRFFEATDFDLLEHDGSYPGDSCASSTHPGHAGYEDSQWTQWRTIHEFYAWCRERGVYLNVPDFYFLSGSNKVAMGYRETNWSLPRAQQILHARQNMFDGTWEKTPSMGWMFVPLTQYHGGGEAAVLEPLSEHLADYDAHLANLLGYGVQACFRGPRLYDTDETRAVVKGWVEFFKAHRAILESDVLHLRRADGRDLDYLLHVNPGLEEKGLLFVHNPLDEEVRKTLRVPLYYTGLTETALVSEQGGESVEMRLDRHYTLQIPVVVPARGYRWFVIR